MTGQPHFTPALFNFLRELRENNNREWFQAIKSATRQTCAIRCCGSSPTLRCRCTS